MIESLKEMGWNFNFIGANIDVAGTAREYNIDNAMEFQQDDAGTREMFELERSCRMSYYQRMNEVQEFCSAEPALCEEERRLMMKKASKNYFRK